MELTDTISLTECRDGFWLYDKTRGMNLAMRAKTERAAFLEALAYYQKRLKEVGSELASLQSAADVFADHVRQERDIETDQLLSDCY